MNITFLIGNGFDVGMGMKSSFKDFFPIYQEISKNKSQNIRQLSEEIGNDYDTWADFESALGRYTQKFDSSTKQNFLLQLRDFEDEFIKYLKSQENLMSYEKTDVISKTIKDALTKYFYSDNLPVNSSNTIQTLYSTYAKEQRIFNFVSFNYTSVLENCLKVIKDNIIAKRVVAGYTYTDCIGKTVHVHGYCDKYPIIGVNDISQISNKELAADKKFTRYIVKPSLNKLLRMNYDNDATEIINKSSIVCIYGMSMGCTDKKWWSSIVMWLNNNHNRHLVIFDYDQKYSSSTQFDWLEKEEAIINKLGKYSGLSETEMEKLRNRIHIAVHKNIFHMDIKKGDIDPVYTTAEKTLIEV